MGDSRPSFHLRSVFDQESNIHVLAAALDGFFRDVYKQPSSTWIEALKEGILVPFVTRADPPRACLFGDRNPKASSLIQEERPQNWLAWFMPLLTHEDSKSDVLRPSYSGAGGGSITDKMESIWSIGLLFVVSALAWAFVNRPTEVFVNMISDVRSKFEQLGWDELNCARVRRILSAFVAKVNNTKTNFVKTDAQQLKFLENLIALSAVVEDFIFFAPLFGFNSKPDPGLCGLHTDHTGLLDAELLKAVYECILVHANNETKTVIPNLDRKDIKEFKKRVAILEEIKNFLQIAVHWSVAASNFLSRKSERAWVAGRADGLHVAVGDRVLIKQNRLGELMASVAYKGNAGGGGVHIGVVFDGPMGGSNGTFGGKQLFTCAEGCGALVKPENAFSLEDVAGKQEYDRLATAVIEGVSKRPYFKGNKKQVRETFEEVLRPNRKGQRGADKRSLGSTFGATLSASFADVSFETCVEQMKTGAYSLRRTVRYLTKIQEAKAAYLVLLDKANLEEGGKQMDDQMELFVQGQQAILHIEHALGARDRQFLAEVATEVIIPFQALEKDYDNAVQHFKLQHATVEKTIEAGQALIVKELAECEKDLQDLRKMKLDVDAGRKTGADLQKYTKQLQFVAGKVAQYDAASQRFKDDTYMSLRRTQKSLRLELQAVEHRRLVLTQVYLQRYLTACDTFTSPHPQLKHFTSLVADLAPGLDISIFVAINRRPDPEYYIQKTSSSATDIMSGNIAVTAPLSPGPAGSPSLVASGGNTMVPPFNLGSLRDDSPTSSSSRVSTSRHYRTWGRGSSRGSANITHTVVIQPDAAATASPFGAPGSPTLPQAPPNEDDSDRASDSSTHSNSSSTSYADMSLEQMHTEAHEDGSVSRDVSVSSRDTSLPRIIAMAQDLASVVPGPSSPVSEAPSSPFSASPDGGSAKQMDKARSVVGLSQAVRGVHPLKLSFGSSASTLSLGSLPSPPCPDCKCQRFSPSFVKKTKCSNCNHVHVTAPKLEA